MKKVCVVTGATSGIGFANVTLLLKEHVDVIAVARSTEKKEKLMYDCQPYLTDDTQLHIVTGDLSSIRQVNQLTEDIKNILDQHYEGRLDVLMNVAGMVSSGKHLNEDGNEITFAVNHLAVFLLTQNLIPYLEKSEDPRVLVVSSLSHYRARINFNNLQNFKFYHILKAYQRSKLYNVLFVKEFHKRHPRISIFAIDPGLVKTEIGLKNTSHISKAIWIWRVSKGTDAFYPASFMVRIALDDEYRSLSGEYFKEGQVKKSNPLTYDQDKASRLYEITQNMINKKR
jgi:NAD(P)-dependent dehydrogenase (short-subunit alcohol dehydrogenase family)